MFGGLVVFNGLVVYGGGAMAVEEGRFARSSRYLSSWWRWLSEGFILKLFLIVALKCRRIDPLVKVVLGSRLFGSEEVCRMTKYFSNSSRQVTNLLERGNKKVKTQEAITGIS